MITSGQTTQEMVVKDALEGVPIPIGMAIVKFAGSDPDVSKTEEFYVYGTERVAMIVPNTLGTTPSRIQFNEATYFLTDHLGNTRVAYMATTTTNHDAYIINAVEEFAFANEDEMATNVRAKAMRYYPYGKVLREYDNGAGDRYLTTQHERDRETGLDYRGARYYDSDVARFLSLDPLAAKYPSMSPYNYVAGNPIMLIDPDGREIRNSKGEDISTPKHEKETRWTENHVRLNETFGDANGFNSTITSSPEWASGMGYHVHQQANFVATYNRYIDHPWKGDCYVTKILNSATVYADGAQFQTSAMSYRHGMRGPKQSVAEAKALSDEFVRSRYERAINHYHKGEYGLAYYNLGVALHTLQDATSPAHKGFQIWDEHSSKWSQYKHGMSETVYPGPDSNLIKVTNWFLDSFENGQSLPIGNIFDLDFFK